MRIREPRAGWTWFLWLWAAIFGGVPLFILIAGSGGGDAPELLLLLFPAIAVAVLVPIATPCTRCSVTVAPCG